MKLREPFAGSLKVLGRPEQKNEAIQPPRVRATPFPQGMPVARVPVNAQRAP